MVLTHFQLILRRILDWEKIKCLFKAPQNSLLNSLEYVCSLLTNLIHFENITNNSIKVLKINSVSHQHCVGLLWPDSTDLDPLTSANTWLLLNPVGCTPEPYHWLLFCSITYQTNYFKWVFRILPFLNWKKTLSMGTFLCKGPRIGPRGTSLLCLTFR